MKRLTLIRHAKSDWKNAALSDFERPLNKRGKKAAPKMGRRMRERDAIPDLLVSSPARRAAKTARLLARELDFPASDILYRDEIFAAPFTTLVTLVRDLPEQSHIALIGHNPGLTDLGLWLCAGAPEWLPTCAVLELELPIERWRDLDQGCAQLLYYDYPKKQTDKQASRSGHHAG